MLGREEICIKGWAVKNKDRGRGGGVNIISLFAFPHPLLPPLPQSPNQTWWAEKLSRTLIRPNKTPALQASL